MSSNELSGVKIQETLHKAHYVLPRRDLGAAKWIGRGLMLMGGMLILVFGGGGIAAAAQQTSGPGIVFGLATAVFPIFIGMMFFNIGRGVTSGRSEIRVTRDKIIAIERLGLMRFKRSRPIAKLKGFEVLHGSGRSSGSRGSGQTVELFPDLAAIRANTDGVQGAGPGGGVSRGARSCPG